MIEDNRSVKQACFVIGGFTWDLVFLAMRGIVPDFPSEVPLLEDVLRGMVEISVLRAA